MKTFVLLLKIAILCSCLGFAGKAANRFLAQRDEMIQVEKMNTTLKAIELQGSVHCDPS